MEGRTEDDGQSDEDFDVPSGADVGALGDDTDSDLEDLQKDIAQLDESVRKFLTSHKGNDGGKRKINHTVSNESRRLAPDSTRGRGPRGPRKAAKPRGDITARLSRVNQAFLSGDYARALDLAFEVIRINAETHQAWTAVASIFREQGEISRAISAMVYAAHLRPKDVLGWLRCADFVLDNLESDEVGNLETARLCCSAAIRAEPHHRESRLRKAAICERQDRLAAATTEYRAVLKRQPHDLETIRRLAEACIDSQRSGETAVIETINYYRQYFDFEIRQGLEIEVEDRWHDVGVHVELFASTGRFHEAIAELKRLSRWLVGRANQVYWDTWQQDDREWDSQNERRLLVQQFVPQHSPDLSAYGDGLPLEFRLRLAIYRLRIQDVSEGLKHLSWLEPSQACTLSIAADFPFLLYDVAVELSHNSQQVLAIRYLTMLRSLMTDADADAALPLVLGRCYLALGENAAAEECFLAAIDADADNVDARIHLANLYEKAREDEEALILAAEALALRDAQGHPHSGGGPSEVNRPYGTLRFRSMHPQDSAKRTSNGKTFKSTKIRVPRRYRPKRLAGNDQKTRDEQARALKLSQKYERTCAFKRAIKEGDLSLIPAWLESSQELVDDFRSLKKFYTWDKYLRFLAPKSTLSDNARKDQPDTELSQMYQRLSSRTLAPKTDLVDGAHPAGQFNSHQSISYDDWLELFLDYAIGIAMRHRREDAYAVCESARDSSTFQSSERRFIIHVAWSVCAILTNDEETCVRISRYLMAEAAMSDSCRMFALLATLCQSPVSWYTSGPAQKFILRHIKALDSKFPDPVVARDGQEDQSEPHVEANSSNPGLDICLLMLYGHILFSSTSYANALSEYREATLPLPLFSDEACIMLIKGSGYFLRARSLDPNNAMVNLSLGLSYTHAGLKRQATNRSYNLLQGQVFMSQYVEIDQKITGGKFKMETLFNVGRLYHLLGVNHLAQKFYEDALHEDRGDQTSQDIRSLIYSNNIVSALMVRNRVRALALMKEGVRL